MIYSQIVIGSFVSLSVKTSFDAAKQSLNALFEKNRKSLEKLESLPSGKGNGQSQRPDPVLLFQRRVIFAHGTMFTKIG